jgi:hypothetical protein
MPPCIRDIQLPNSVTKSIIRTQGAQSRWALTNVARHGMKIIFSRKGFDQRNGRVASPIFPDDGLRSLLIPAVWDQKHPPAPRYRVSYKDLHYGTVNLGALVEDLTFAARKNKPRIRRDALCIFSPDLIRGDRPRRAGWLPLLGQSGAALSHLFKQGIRPGDLFLFFGWFHRVKKVGGHFRFDPDKADAHIIFGWLQVGEIWCQFKPEAYLPKWARHHPQVQGELDELYDLAKPYSAIFIAKRHLDLPFLRRRLPGGGIFPTYSRRLLLTSLEKGRRDWRLPAWMYPGPDKPPLSYHGDRRRWRKASRGWFLRTVDIGQEFVLDTEYYPKAYQWLAGLFRAAA